LFLDQATKYLIVRYVHPFEAIQVFPFLHIVSFRNPGSAFGMFQDIGSGFFITVSIIAISFIVWMLIQGKEGFFGLSLILGGAIGNLTDRIRSGEVVDFILFSLGRFQWPAFNVADSALTVGITLLVATTLLKKGDREDAP
jgi:signal peptidase II